MKSPAPFVQAAERHLSDAEYLFKDTRLDNADHLFGFAAECALKAVMVGLGMSMGQNATPQEKRYRVHADGIWTQFVAFSQGHFGAEYVRILQGQQPNDPFRTWRVERRYDPDGSVASQDLCDHRDGAMRACSVLSQARLDGVVT